LAVREAERPSKLLANVGICWHPAILTKRSQFQ
jgi:hypothetical protein